VISEFESYPVGAYGMTRITNFRERRLTGPRSRAKKERAPTLRFGTYAPNSGNVQY
jgi:hypothetical protein